MEQSINVDFQNLTEEERETLLKLCEKSQKKEVKKGLWTLNKNELYYYITNYGKISCCLKFFNSSYDEWRIINNNCFKTEKEAEFELEKRKVLYELRKFAVENNTEEINWNDSNQEKYTICYNYEDEWLCVSPIWSIRNIHDIYFTSRDICNEAIEEIGEDRIKKYLFNVECYKRFVL